MQNNLLTVTNEFDEQEWRKSCEDLAKEAHNGCGLSYEYYVERFSVAVDGALGMLSEIHRKQAILVARDWDYASIEEREEQQKWLSENDYCSHGIELGCCPAGCGS